ncbi:MAG: hypothetical protein J4F38_02020 [Pseudomonadales bacterium]|nr:hypothetical protein [Pseudomonadales bacterium]
MPDALQLCPHDQEPFLDVCAGHAKALESLGFRVRTVFFERRRQQRSSAHFDFIHTPPRELARVVGRHAPELLVSHRHGAYRGGWGFLRTSSWHTSTACSRARHAGSDVGSRVAGTPGSPPCRNR